MTGLTKVGPPEVLKSSCYDSRLAGNSPANGKAAGLPAVLRRCKGTRGVTMARGMACVNFRAPNVGLGGVPVAASAKALRAKGLRPFFKASRPAPVNTPT